MGTQAKWGAQGGHRDQQLATPLAANGTWAKGYRPQTIGLGPLAPSTGPCLSVGQQNIVNPIYDLRGKESTVPKVTKPDLGPLHITPSRLHTAQGDAHREKAPLLSSKPW